MKKLILSVEMMTTLKKYAAAAFAVAMLAVAFPAHALEVTVIGNRNRFELDKMIQFDDLKAAMKASMQYMGYPGETMYSQNDPDLFTADTDARCNNYIRQTLNGQTASNSNDQQKIDKALATITQFKGHPSAGGLGYAMGARSGIAPQPSGYASLVAGMKTDSNGFRLMQIIYQDGSSASFKLIIPGGSGGDKNNATLTSSSPISSVLTPTQTTGSSSGQSGCPF